MAPYTPQICYGNTIPNIFQFLTGVLPSVPFSAFTILRGVALLQNHVWKLIISWILAALSFGLFVAGTYGTYTSTWVWVTDPVFGSYCAQAGFSVSSNVAQRLTVTQSICGILGAAIVLFITLFKTTQHVWQANSLRLATTLGEVLLRDGSLFFLMVLLDDLIETIPVINEVILQGSVGVVLDQMFTILPHILLSRFLINLRQVATPSDSRQQSHFSTLNFRMPTMDEVMDNLGEPMDFVQHRSNCDDEGWEDGCHGIEGKDAPADRVLWSVAGPHGSTLEVPGPSESGNGSSSEAHIDVVDIRGSEIQEECRLSAT